jgi:hypothetical protein
LVKAYDEAELKEPTNIWNADETGFGGDQGEKKILCARGTKRPLCITGDNEKIHYTVQNCCNARGDYLPPMIIYKAKTAYMILGAKTDQNEQYLQPQTLDGLKRTSLYQKFVNFLVNMF